MRNSAGGYYTNHTGFRGTVQLLHQSAPLTISHIQNNLPNAESLNIVVRVNKGAAAALKKLMPYRLELV